MNTFNNSNTILTEAPQLDGSVVSNIEYLYITQDYSTIASWSPIESIVVTSSSLPVHQTNQGNVHFYVNGLEKSIGQGNNTKTEILDVKSTEITEGVIYQPYSVRWLSLYPQNELSQINLEFYYRNKYNQALVPIQLNAGGIMSLKLAFKRI